MRPWRGALVAVALAALSACTSFSLVEPRGRVDVGDAFSVEPQIAWSRHRSGETEIWTVDGPFLQQLRFVKGLPDGDPLFKVRGRGMGAKKLPKFRKDMTAIEVAELFEAALGRVGGQQITVENLRPERFGNVDGFRFEFRYLTTDGLAKEGFVLGAVKDGRLYMAGYWGTSIYYYPKHKEDAEKVIASIRFR